MLKGVIDSVGANAKPGFIFSVYDDTGQDDRFIAFLCQASDDRASSGTFMDTTPETLTRISDPAVRTLIARFASEHVLGNFGMYIGDSDTGEVHPIARSRS